MGSDDIVRVTCGDKSNQYPASGYYDPIGRAAQIDVHCHSHVRAARQYRIGRMLDPLVHSQSADEVGVRAGSRGAPLTAEHAGHKGMPWVASIVVPQARQRI